MKQLYFVLLASFMFLVFSMHFTLSTDLNQDLGRHIKIGEIIANQKYIPHTNLFSYTNPGFPFSNHHWLSEVLFYRFSNLFGLQSLILIKVFLFIGAIGLLIYNGYRLGYPLITIGTAIIISPLLLERSTIRPEIFGYLIFSYILFVFFQYPKQKKLLYYLPLCMVLWINLHISFIFGVAVIGLLLVKIIWMTIRNKKKISSDVYILLGSLAASLLNPHGVFGILYPINIFNNYGYTIVENQNIFFLNSIMLNPHIRYLFLLSPIIIASAGILIFKKKIFEALLLSIFFIATMMQIRHMPFFALVAIPAISLSIRLVTAKIKLKQTQRILISVVMTVMCIGLSIFFIQDIYSNTFDLQESFGMKVREEGKGGAEFILQKKLPGQLFNNFDIGGYAIYKLYPAYSVFVDNRPEAYPNDFLQNVYIKLQTDSALRKKIFKQYNINTIYFAHTDQTYWAEAFMKDILADKQWRLVYLDDYSMVLTTDKQNPDVREDEKYLSALLNKADYISALKLSRFFSIMQNSILSDQAFTKAAELNAASCVIQKSFYYQYAGVSYTQKANDIKSKFWYCF